MQGQYAHRLLFHPRRRSTGSLSEVVFWHI
ncbi:hypothetical protein QN277_005809 [Acacia crassicarpa]|uniref:Uncharacterized protein n=1 Tax=Acacia crassicarpa TaxID=499986 RepID=A0AAE1IZY0_9FABA|nr:hypothetical protein QN277_005809 [Acacia crassicarpa]